MPNVAKVIARIWVVGLVPPDTRAVVDLLTLLSSFS